MSIFGFLRPNPGTGPLKAYYEASQPTPSTPLNELNLLAVDIETTGLRPDRDEMLSIGWVAVDGGGTRQAPHARIRCGMASHYLLKAAGVGQSAIIHGITDDAIAEAGRDQRHVLEEFLGQLQGRALLCHFSAIETRFLAAACKKHFGAALKVPTVVDTFAIERRHMERMATYPRGEDLRLPRVRARYGLTGKTRAHNALSDALACAELYLAQLANTRARTPAQLY